MFKRIANISPFGGIFAIKKQIKNKKVSEFINQELGSRSLLTTYSYADAMLTNFYTVLCGGSAIEDVNYIRENTLAMLKNFQAPSADTILRINKELSVPSEYIDTRNSENLINVNAGMNKFLIRSAKFLNVKLGLNFLFLGFFRHPISSLSKWVRGFTAPPLKTTHIFNKHKSF